MVYGMIDYEKEKEIVAKVAYLGLEMIAELRKLEISDRATIRHIGLTIARIGFLLDELGNDIVKQENIELAKMVGD